MTAGRCEQGQPWPPDADRILREEIARAATRAAWPELLTARDLAVILGIEASAARRRVARGELGEVLRFGRRIHVTRDSFRAALKGRTEKETHDARLSEADSPPGTTGHSKELPT